MNALGFMKKNSISVSVKRSNNSQNGQVKPTDFKAQTTSSSFMRFRALK